MLETYDFRGLKYSILSSTLFQPLLLVRSEGVRSCAMNQGLFKYMFGLQTKTKMNIYFNQTVTQEISAGQVKNEHEKWTGQSKK